MNKTNNSNIDSLINDLEMSIQEVNSIYGDIEFGDSPTIGRIGFLIESFNTNFKPNLIEKDESTIKFLTNMNQKFELESTWPFKLKNVFDFVKEIFFGVTGISMWISAFEEIKKRDIMPVILKSFIALFIPAVFVGFVLSIIYVIVPVIVIMSLLAMAYFVAICKDAYDEIYVHNQYERNKPIEEIQQRNKVRNDHQKEISKFRSLFQKYIKEYEPPDFDESEPIDEKQNLDIHKENKNKTDIIKDSDEQSSEKDKNQKDDNEHPTLASLYNNTIDTKTHESTKKNDKTL